MTKPDNKLRDKLKTLGYDKGAADEMASHIEGNSPPSAAADFMRLTWSEQTPLEEGWYWYREEGCEKMPTKIRESYSFYHQGRMRAGMKCNSCYYRWADEAPGEWAGPIPEPKDAV